jgi:glutamate racemase
VTVSCPPPRIGIFDSGLGGLSVWREVQRILPAASFMYVADSAHAPYGDRSAEYIVDRARAIAGFLISQHIDALLIACNTASAHAADVLRNTYSLPIIAMEPAIKPAAQISRSKKIAILATSQTLASERVQRLVARHGASVQILFQACPGLVEWVEAGAQDSAEPLELLDHYVHPLIAQGVDTLVLGCTHYPFLKKHIEHAIQKSRAALQDPLLPSQVELIDPAPAVAQELVRRLSTSFDLTDHGRLLGENLRRESADEGLLFYSNHRDLTSQTNIIKMLGMNIKVRPFRD